MHGTRAATALTVVAAVTLAGAGGRLVGHIGPYSLAQPTPLGLVAVGLLGLTAYPALCTPMTDWLRPTPLPLRAMRAGWWILVAVGAAAIASVAAGVQLGETSGSSNAPAYARNVLLAVELSTLSGCFARGRMFWALPATYWLCALVGGVSQFSDRVDWWAAVLDPHTRPGQWLVVAVVGAAVTGLYALRGAPALH